MGHLIRNCCFRFKCGMTWDMMDVTNDPVVRHCGGCERDVHFCATDHELAQAMLENHCVAIPSEGTVYENLEELPQMTVGMIDVEYDTDDPGLPK